MRKITLVSIADLKPHEHIIPERPMRINVPLDDLM